MKTTIHKSLLLETIRQIESGAPITFPAATSEESARLPELLQVGAAACCVAVRQLTGALGMEKFVAGAGLAARNQFFDELLRSAKSIALTILPDLRSHEECCKRVGSLPMIPHFAGHFVKRTAIEPHGDAWTLSQLGKLASTALAVYARRTQADHADLTGAVKAAWAAFCGATDLAGILSPSSEVAAVFGEVVTIETSLDDAGRPTIDRGEGWPDLQQLAEVVRTGPAIFMEEAEGKIKAEMKRRAESN